MSPISRAEQLRYICEGRVREAVAKHLHGDWARRLELFDLPRADFDAWADSVTTLPERIHTNSATTYDGIYLVREGDRWKVRISAIMIAPIGST